MVIVVSLGTGKSSTVQEQLSIRESEDLYSFQDPAILI